MEIYLVRHGQTASNIIRALDTDCPGAPLNVRGRAQAAALPREWERLGLPRPDGIVASPLLRTRQTAAPLARHFGLPVVLDAGLREVRAGDLEMMYERDAPLAYLAVIASWLGGDLWRRMPGGEVGAHVLGRLDAALARAERRWGEDSRVAFVMHGGVTRLFSASRMEGISPSLVMSHPARNCSITSGVGTCAGGWSARLYSSRPLDEFEAEPGVRLVTSGVEIRSSSLDDLGQDAPH